MGVSVVNPDASGAASPAAGKQDSSLEVYPGRASGAYLLRERTMRVRCARIVLPSALAVACWIAALMDWPKLWRKDGGASAGPPTSLVLGATVAAARPRRRQAEQRAAIFSNLGRRLSAVRTPKEAAQIILEGADALWQWDAAVLGLCSNDSARMDPIICIDLVNGRRTDIPVETVQTRLSAIARKTLEEGPQLTLRTASAGFSPDTLPFGDKSRPSASLMYVPLRKDAQVIGLLSIQSYTPNAYNEEDLSILQALADHCGGALLRIRAEAALDESNDRLRMALAAARMGTWTRELDGQDRLFRSPELEAIFGLEPGEFTGTEEALYESIHPEDRELVRQAFERAIKIQSDYEVEFRFLPRGRPPGWLLTRGRAYYDDAGKPLRLVGVAIDITARKEAEQEISRLNAELEQRVRERTAQLEAANQELEAFAYSVSHDLRAPLRGIRGFSEILLEDHARQLDATGRDLLRRVCESSERMGRLIEDLTELSRVGRSELRWQPVNLSAQADAIAAELRSAEPARAVEFIIQPNLQAEGDECLLKVLLDNLLRNAWKFTRYRPEGRIEFGFATRPEPAFFVRDNGIGFDMAHVGKLFGVFQRLHSDSEFPGTGVGLATVERIVKRHGGRVWGAGRINEGATFHFTLPDGRHSEL